MIRTRRAFGGPGIARALHRDKPLVVIAHRLSALQHCDALHLLQDGRLIAAGRAEEIAEVNPDFRDMPAARG